MSSYQRESRTSSEGAEYLTGECQLLKVGRMTNSWEFLFCSHRSNHWFRQETNMDAVTTAHLVRNEVLTSSQSISSPSTYFTQEQMLILEWGNLADVPYGKGVAKVHISNNRAKTSISCRDAPRTHRAHYSVFLPRPCNLNLIWRKQPTLQNRECMKHTACTSNDVKVIEDKGCGNTQD